jgi:hypothetical protein
MVGVMLRMIQNLDGLIKKLPAKSILTAFLWMIEDE